MEAGKGVEKQSAELRYEDAKARQWPWGQRVCMEARELSEVELTVDCEKTGEMDAWTQMAYCQLRPQDGELEGLLLRAGNKAETK